MNFRGTETFRPQQSRGCRMGCVHMLNIAGIFVDANEPIGSRKVMMHFSLIYVLGLLWRSVYGYENLWTPSPAILSHRN